MVELFGGMFKLADDMAEAKRICPAPALRLQAMPGTRQGMVMAVGRGLVMKFT